jgi:hypothetical protein
MHASRDSDSLIKDFRFHRVVGLCQSLEDLRSWFPRHSALAVASSLRRWRDWISANETTLRDESVDRDRRVREVLLRQGDLWKDLLTGEQSATDMLRSEEYVDAALGLAAESQALLGRLVRRYAVTLTIAAIALLAALALAIAATGPAEAVAAAVTAATALGVTWKGIGASIRHLAGRLREPLWQRQLDSAVATAIDQLPALEPKQRQAPRRRLRSR